MELYAQGREASIFWKGQLLQENHDNATELEHFEQLWSVLRQRAIRVGF